MSLDNDIRKQFQDKLSGIKASVPADGWERLEEALNAAPAAPVARLPRRRWRYAVASAAAVLLLIVGSLLLVRQPWDQGGPMLTDSAAPAPSTRRPSTPVTEPERIADDAGRPEVVPRHPATVESGEALLAAETPVSRKGESIVPARPSAIIAAPSHRERVEKAIGAINARGLNAMATPFEREDRSEETLFAETGHKGLLAGHARQDDREPLLLAVSGRGGLSSYQQTVNTPMTLRGASAAANQPEEGQKNVFASQKVTDNVAEMEHDQPVSFGITVSKAIVDNLYIETGLVYSYLYSKTRNASANFKENETQRLHYIGVPLNVNYNVFSLHRLNVYASVGGMIEKDIHGDFRRLGEGETMINSRSEEMEVTSISQRNPQVSVNAGIGLSYPVYDRLRLYGKIGGSYYFDAKNEHKTIYSDRKIVMDLNVGLRYEF
ncbi:MAG: hypothetical protein WC914_03250 [Proteiniphilum sp.]